MNNKFGDSETLLRMKDDPFLKYDTYKQELGVGVSRWNALRAEWTRASKSALLNNKKQQTEKLDIESIVKILIQPCYDRCQPFIKPVPLPKMVNILIELWEVDGLYEEQRRKKIRRE